MGISRAHSTISGFYALVCVTAGLLVGCAGAAPNTPATADFDRPVPAGEPRGKVALVLDLPGASDCEERFDLSIYQDRRIELVAWDDSGGCLERRVEIRYLTADLDEPALLEIVRTHAKRVKKSKP